MAVLTTQSFQKNVLKLCLLFGAQQLTISKISKIPPTVISGLKADNT
jgi:hypothetical protein